LRCEQRIELTGVEQALQMKRRQVPGGADASRDLLPGDGTMHPADEPIYGTALRILQHGIALRVTFEALRFHVLVLSLIAAGETS